MSRTTENVKDLFWIDDDLHVITRDGKEMAYTKAVIINRSIPESNDTVKVEVIQLETM